MDFAINHIWEYSEYARNELVQEWSSCKYKRLSDCPSYAEVQAYCRAYNALIDYYYAPEQRHHQTPKSVIKEYI